MKNRVETHEDMIDNCFDDQSCLHIFLRCSNNIWSFIYNYVSSPFTVYYELTTWTTFSLLDSSVGSALHRYRRGYGFASRSVLIFFTGNHLQRIMKCRLRTLVETTDVEAAAGFASERNNMKRSRDSSWRTFAFIRLFKYRFYFFISWRHTLRDRNSYFFLEMTLCLAR